MIHEDITISGSFQASGSFILPRIPSNSLATATTGSMFYDTVNDVVKIYTGTGSTTDGYITVGAQSAFSDTAPAGPEDIDYLLVAGGGGGGRGSAGGGGGAGGLKSSSLSDVESGSSFTITIGAGGSGGNDASATNSNDGSDSSIAGSTITTITATGGGKGANESGTAGGDGGSGGGGSYILSPGDGTVGQGNDGGTGFGGNPHYAGGGGGGAGAAGGNADSSTAGLGGIGKLSHITGTGSYYAGGGSGDFQDTADGSVQTHAGGLGGGGTGGSYRSTTSATAATDGAANTGGGGGGGTNSGTGFDGIGGTGGSGVAIFAYPTSSITAQGGTKTSRADGQFVHTFKESGTLTVGGPTSYTIAPGDHFNTVLYTGTDTSHAITGVGFQPDFVWIKRRNSSEPHAIYDSVRGINKQLSSDQNIAEATNSSPYEGFTSFDSDGFTVDNNGGTNRAPNTYVAWCWKAADTTTTIAANTVGNTIASDVRANQDAGFSIVKYTGNGTAGATIGHGLSSTPSLIIWKNLDATSNWLVYSPLIGSDSEWLYLNLTTSKQDSGNTNEYPTNKVNPTSSVVTVNGAGSSNNINISGQDTIMYCFHSVTGHQKIGSYDGTGNANNQVTVGFRPRFLIIKSDSEAEPWFLLDSTRDTGNPRDNRLMADSSAAEDDGSVHTVDFTDTGFTANGTVGNGTNGSGVSYIYLAIA